MADPIETEDFEVIICGCGPTGALLSANLSWLGVKHVIIEKDPAITTDPRGIALDEDGIRLVQGVGKYKELFTDVGTAMGFFRFIDGGKGLHVKPFLQINNNTITGGTGHPGFISHKQPALEKHLRNAIDKDFGELRAGCTLSAINEDDRFVYVEYQTPSGAVSSIRGKFLVGADGKTGFTRKMYLEPKGVMMEKSSKFHYEEVWVALNWRLTLPTPTSHPKFPLWKLGYSPEEVYDLFFPRDFNFICDPSRPAVCGRFGKTSDRLWRFEFVVKEGEDPQHMATPLETQKIIFPYLTHPGKSFSLTEDVIWPTDCIECIRSRPFSFSARSCNRWSLGRVSLCGDAAHVFPPFGGQGIASGFRDAVSLAWRLKLAISPSYPNYDSLFRGWYTERKQQLERSLAATIANGNYCVEPSRLKAFARNWLLWFEQLVPSWKYDLELGPRKAGMMRYDYTPDTPFLADYGGGISLPQVFAAPIDQPAPPLPMFTDDVIFSKQKRGVFQVVALAGSLEQLQDIQSSIATVGKNYDIDDVLLLAETTYIMHSYADQKSQDFSNMGPILQAESIVRVIDAQEYKTAGETRDALAEGFPRPKPINYDPYRIYNDLGKDVLFAVVRWDRIVFARCRSLSELKAVLEAIDSVLRGSPSKSQVSPDAEFSS